MFVTTLLVGPYTEDDITTKIMIPNLRVFTLTTQLVVHMKIKILDNGKTKGFSDIFKYERGH